jgi:hypothetical protein
MEEFETRIIAAAKAARVKNVDRRFMLLLLERTGQF